MIKSGYDRDEKISKPIAIGIRKNFFRSKPDQKKVNQT